MASISRLAGAPVLAMFLALAACDTAERQEATRVVTAVARFRSADPTSTAAALEGLKATPCTSGEVCAARDACVAAGESTATALRLKGEVARGLASIESGALAKDSPEARTLPSKLDAAELMLKKGHDGLPACDEQVQALKRKHRI